MPAQKASGDNPRKRGRGKSVPKTPRKKVRKPKAIPPLKKRPIRKPSKPARKPAVPTRRKPARRKVSPPPPKRRAPSPAKRAKPKRAPVKPKRKAPKRAPPARSGGHKPPREYRSKAGDFRYKQYTLFGDDLPAIEAARDNERRTEPGDRLVNVTIHWTDADTGRKVYRSSKYRIDRPGVAEKLAGDAAYLAGKYEIESYDIDLTFTYERETEAENDSED